MVKINKIYFNELLHIHTLINICKLPSIMKYFRRNSLRLSGMTPHMYLDYYGFTEKPFTLTPNPRFIFFSPIHKEAFALLLYGINNRSGFMELIGEVGTGKTTVLRTLLSQLDDETCRTALVLNPPPAATDLLRAINHEFGISAESGNIAELLGELNRYLLRENTAGRTVVLIIDEAQTLAPEVLEQVRLISNLETDTDKLIQIVLAGQPELATLLERQELRQLNQRIALRYRMKPLGGDDTRAYIEHRLDMAGAGRKASFTPWSLRLIYRYTRGTPRLINMLCDRALLIGYTENSRKITGRIATLAWRDITLKDLRLSPALLLGCAAAIIVPLVVVLSGLSVQTPPSLRNLAVTPSSAREKAALANGTTAAAGVDPASLKKVILAELAIRSGEKSAILAFNAVTARWHASSVTRLSDHRPLAGQLDGEAARRNLVMTPFVGSLDDLIRLGLPALIPLTAPDNGEDSFIAMTGVRNTRLEISPSLVGRTSFSRAEFIPLWPGKAYFIWRNYDGIPPALVKGARGARVRKLQALMKKAGSPGLAVDGIYETGTVKAIQAFQASQGLPTTGTLDPITLLLLYRTARYPGMSDSPSS
jgi:general secretion pathway protein A